MSMMTSYILKFVGSPKTQKSKYLENETLFLFQIKKLHSLLYIKGCNMAKNNFVVQETFKMVKQKQLKTFLTIILQLDYTN